VEDTPLGTAGSVKNASDFLDEDFIVMSGDAICDFDLQEAIRAHKGQRRRGDHRPGQVESRLNTNRHLRRGGLYQTLRGKARLAAGLFRYRQHGDLYREKKSP
jgi:NDP-sugar pyrophosphorylase family protein